MKPQIHSIVITGAGSGIGRQLSYQMSDHGIKVLAVGRTQEKLTKTASYNQNNIIPVNADITSELGLAKIQKEAINLPGNLALFHAAGYYQLGKLPEIGIEKWQQSFDVNVTARLLLTQKLLNHLKEGRILFIGSDAGQNVRIGAGTYSIAQSASQTLVNVLKQELREYKISVNSFKPGLVDTDMVKNFMKSSVQEFPSVNDYKEIIQNGQIATPDKVAQFARWLLLETKNSEYIEKTWDIRDQWHHSFWLHGDLY